MRRPLGTTVFAGMLGVTFFGLILTPVYYCVIRRFTGRTNVPPGNSSPPDVQPLDIAAAP